MTWSYTAAKDTCSNTPAIPAPTHQELEQGHGVQQPEAMNDTDTMPTYDTDHDESMVGAANLPRPSQTFWAQEMEIDSHPVPAITSEENHASIADTTGPHSYSAGYRCNSGVCTNSNNSENLAFRAPGVLVTSGPKTTSPFGPTTPPRRYIPKVTDFALPRFRRYKQSLAWRRQSEEFDKYS